jgi:hypothetical protein
MGRLAAPDQRAAAVGDALQQIAEERGVHRNHRSVHPPDDKELMIARGDDKLAKTSNSRQIPPALSVNARGEPTRECQENKQENKGDSRCRVR